MQDNTVTPADPPTELSAAVVRWNEFAKAVAHVLDSGPSECRTTLLEALQACYEELKKVARHLPPYKGDAPEVVTRVEEAKIALSNAIFEGETAPDLPPAELLEPVPVTVTEPEPVPVPQPEPAAGPEPDRTMETDAPRATAAESGMTAVNEPEPAPEPGPLDRFMDRMGTLCRELGNHKGQLSAWPHARPEARTGAADPQQVAAVWTALHMALLRLPDHDRRIWRDRVAEAAQECLGTTLASRNPTVIVPALPRPGGRGEADLADSMAREVTVALELDDADTLKKAAADAPSDILEEMGIGDVDAFESHDPRLLWAARAGQALELAELDRELFAMIHPRARPVPLAAEGNRREYRNTLLANLRSAARAHHQKLEWDTRLGFAHTLDGVLGGLLHIPSAAHSSWWWRWRRHVSLILDPLAHEADREVVFDQTAEWQKSDLDGYTETAANLRGTEGQDEPLVQWVLLTPLRRIGTATPLPDFRGKVVRRPDPKAK
ncbi:hypothetical protein OH805_00200 [Streptomyces sp. NBC_00879]|uniref:hypothetical protein n=1 Tax=Streptomyces sp. NBC_00879 TaxID=2975855 RepID=UPI00386D1098|nr:hypothetical protein OH805_00200 [Streptomyces sp. NBC_00879]